MSASRKKKERNLQMAEAEQVQKKPSKLSKQTRDTIIICCVVVAALAALAVGVLIYRDQQLKPDYDVSKPAGTVGSNNVSVPAMNYFYMDAVNSFYSQYGGYISILLDPSLPLSEQAFNGSLLGVTEEYASWDDYFIAQAKDRAADTYNVYSAAIAEGRTLTEEDEKYIDTALDSIKDTADKAGFRSAKEYLTTLYGPGCTLENYEEFLKVQQLASAYSTENLNAIEVSDEEVTNSYAEDSTVYDGVDYYSFTASANGSTDDDGNHIDATEEEIKKAAEDAEAMKKDYDESKASLLKNRSKATISQGYSEDMANWLFDASRKAGDIQSFKMEGSNTTYVLKYVGKDDHNYNTANIKLLKINLDSTSSSEDKITDDQTEPAADRFAAVKNSLTANKTEENFDALITEYSQDTSVGTDKGVKSDVVKNNYAEEIDTWLFGSARTAGDCEFFETDTGYYAIWFTGYGENYQHLIVENTLLREAQDAWYEEHAHTAEFVADNAMLSHMRTGIVLNDFFASSTSQS